MRPVSRAVLASCLLALSACAPAIPPPPEGTPYIGFSDMSGLHGGVDIRVHADDVITEHRAPPAGTDQSATDEVRQGRPGLYADLAALVAAEGPGVAADIAATPDDGCMDAGTRVVSAVPPVGGFSRLAYSGCSATTLGPFLNRILDLIAG